MGFGERTGWLLIVLNLALSISLRAQADPDWRNIRNGYIIPDEHYADQPYVVRNAEGSWTVVMTTGSGVEGAAGQHVVSLVSDDHGVTWSGPYPIEPPGPPEASYVVPLQTPTGRLFAFYNHNTDNLREVRRVDGGVYTRVDTQGRFVFKYSDDGGRTWSDRRYEVPVRIFRIDRENVYNGEIRFFWTVGKPFTHEGAAFVPLHKVGDFGPGFMVESEGVLLKSPNLLSELDPEKITWETLPDGDTGLRTPAGGGPIAEEQSYVVLSDGSFFAVYRSVDGYPVSSYSRDGGHTWEPPRYLTYADGRKIKHPRAANFIWKTSDGRYLYWFHNHGGRFIQEGLRSQGSYFPYRHRNPAWVSAAVEVDGPHGKVLRFTQPEVLLYDDDPWIRMSYPDLIEDAGWFYITETQKDVARIHPLDSQLLERLWNQFELNAVARDSLVLELFAPLPSETVMPALPRFTELDWSRADHGTRQTRHGFTIDLAVTLPSLEPHLVLLDSRNEQGEGILLETAEEGSLRITLSDGRTVNSWSSDPDVLQPNRLHRATVIVDGGPHIISFVTDGRLNDGGESRQFGWGRFSPALEHAGLGGTLRVAPGLGGIVKQLRIYGRALSVSEAIGNQRAGSP